MVTGTDQRRLEALIDVAGEASVWEINGRPWVEYAPPIVFRLIWRGLVPLMRRPPVNVIVSNVAGPREPPAVGGDLAPE